ncbi:hypothetical protein BGX28_009944, partial [Mortierella sp. GBA30]
MEIVVPVLYAFQWFSWCIALICLVTLRLTEEQESKDSRDLQEARPTHSVEESMNQINTSNDPRMRQHLFNFRHSVISPSGGTTDTRMRGAGVSSPRGSSDSSSQSTMSRINKGKEPMARYHSREISNPQIPGRSWSGQGKRFSSDSANFFIPNDRRISQVVLTFRDEEENAHEHQSGQSQVLESSMQRPFSIRSKRRASRDPTILYRDQHNYDRDHSTVGDGAPSNIKSDNSVYVLNFSTPGESLSEMIFKSVPSVLHPRPALAVETVSPVPPLNSPEIVQKEKNLDSSKDSVHNVHNLARIRATATKVSLTLSSDSSSSEMSTSTSATSTDGDYFQLERTTADTLPISSIEESSNMAQEGIVAKLALVSAAPLSIAHKEHKRHRHLLN